MLHEFPRPAPLLRRQLFAWKPGWRAVPAVAVLALSQAVAFPPAPDFTIHGIIRDQVGQRLGAEGGARVVLLRDQLEVAGAPLTSTRLDENYRLAVRLDANRPGTVAYRERSFTTNEPYSLAVELNGVRFYPIEVAGNLRIGQPGTSLRLDLNLGEDRDGDGLPDAWEEWQLYQAGRFPGTNGEWDLSLVSRDGDLDGDGIRDGLEYIAGTFAGDATETFTLEIKGRGDGVVSLEFYQIIGKTYTIEHSAGGTEWQPIPFVVGAAPASRIYQAAAIGVVPVAVLSNADRALYRLTVR